jgi:hypothetical protein
MKTKIMIFAASFALSASAAFAQIAPAGIPSTGIGPAPTSVVPGGVVPVPAPNTSPTTNTTGLTPPPPPIGVNAVPGIPAQRPNGTATVNTFSEQQVRSNLMAQGFSGVAGLTVDGAGAWHGMAVRNGASVSVSVDANGMVTPQ